MRSCVTGSTGFLGSHLAQALLERGDEVRATYRDERSRDLLRARGLEPIRADMLDRTAMRRATRGCDQLFHTAGLVRSTPLKLVYEANALAPRTVVEAAAAEDVARVVHTSSVAALGPAGDDEPITEESAGNGDGLGLVYADAKREGELEAIAAAARTGVELMIVNPSYVLGPTLEPADGRPSSTRIVSGYLRGRLPAVVDGHTNIADVRDVARGHLRAAERGEPGERYLLGGTDIGWVEMVERVGELAGEQHPFLVIPRNVGASAWRAEELGLPLPIAAEGFALMAQDWSCSSRKARAELGYRTRRLDTTLRDTIAWSRELIDSGTLIDRVSPLSLGADAVGLAQRLGGMRGVGLLERAVGRRLVGGRR